MDVSSLGPDAVRFQRPKTRNKPAKKLISNMLRTSTGIPPSTTRTMHMWEAPRRFCSLGLRCVDCSPGRNFADAMILSLRQTREMHCLLVRCSSLVGASSPSMPFRSCSLPAIRSRPCPSLFPISFSPTCTLCSGKAGLIVQISGSFRTYEQGLGSTNNICRRWGKQRLSV